jgi:hypothetical protein
MRSSTRCLWRRTYGSFRDDPDFAFVTEFVDRRAVVNYTLRIGPLETLRHVRARVFASELPLQRGPSEARGSVLEVELTRPAPGRWRDALHAGQNGADFHLLAGAADWRLWHLDIAGTHSRHLVFCAQYSDLQTRGAGREEAMRHPDTRAKAGLMQSGDPPHLGLRSDVFSEIGPDDPA